MPKTFTPKERAKGAKVRKEKSALDKVARDKATVYLIGGAKAYPDVSPGTGYVLEQASGHKSYWISMKQAREVWTNEWCLDRGVRGEDGSLVPPWVA